MKHMLAWGIGLSLICASGCAGDLETEASGSIPTWLWNIDVAPMERRCYGWQTPDSDTVIIASLLSDGFPLRGEIECTEDFFTSTTTATTE